MPSKAGQSGRVSCCIPGCGRSWKQSPDDHEDAETMCRRHWKMGDLALRERHRHLIRRLRKIERLARRHAIRARGEARLDRAWSAVGAACNRLWALIREDVTIKAAFGVEAAPRRSLQQQKEASW